MSRRREGQAAAAIEGNGFVRVARGEAGDLLLLAAGVAQAHLAVLTGEGFVHADARLRRVVETPGAPGWPVIGVWRWGSGSEVKGQRSVISDR